LSRLPLAGLLLLTFSEQIVSPKQPADTSYLMATSLKALSNGSIEGTAKTFAIEGGRVS